MWYIQHIRPNPMNNHKEVHTVAYGTNNRDIRHTLDHILTKYIEDNDYESEGICADIIQVDYSLNRAFKFNHEDVWVLYHMDASNNVYIEDQRGIKPSSFWVIDEIDNSESEQEVHPLDEEFDIVLEANI